MHNGLMVVCDGSSWQGWRGLYSTPIIRYLPPRGSKNTKRGLDMQRVKIHTENDDTIYPTHVTVGNTELHCVTDIKMDLGVDRVPKFTISCNGIPDDIDTIGDVTIVNSCEPKNMLEAYNIIRKNCLDNNCRTCVFEVEDIDGFHCGLDRLRYKNVTDQIELNLRTNC